MFTADFPNMQILVKEETSTKKTLERVMETYLTIATFGGDGMGYLFPEDVFKPMLFTNSFQN